MIPLLKATTMKQFSFLSLLTLCVISLYACIAGENRNTIKLNDADNNKTVHATVGQEIILKLVSNESTGYSWAYTDAVGSIIKLLDDKYEVNPKFKDRDGAGGMHTFHFKVEKAGTAELMLVYSRSWEKPPSWQQQYKLTVTAK
jgi:inhibitor of cysteine peptidase